MTDAAACLASFVKLSTLADGTVRAVIDIEPKDRAAAFALFDAPGAPVAVARISNTAAVEHDRRQQAQATERKPMALASKIALTCRDPEFHDFMVSDQKAFPVLWYKVLAGMKDEPEPNVATAEALVKRQCNVQRKRDIEGNPEAYEQWVRLYRDFQQWRGSRELARRTGRAA